MTRISSESTSSRPRLLCGTIVVVALCYCASTVAAEGASQPAVPAPLQPWVDWVLHEHKDLRCTATDDGRACAWPGVVKLHLQPDGALFELQAWRDRGGSLAIPGAKALWPQNVSVDGQLALVTDDGKARPQVHVSAGHHVIRGRFHWKRPPELLVVPPAVGIISMTRGDVEVALPRREGERAWLSSDAKKESDSDTLRVEVQRWLRDGVPLRIRTRLLLKVGGRSRDVILGRVLVAGSIPVSMSSPVPAQVARNGHARAHVRAGSHVITIDAIHAGDPKELVAPGPIARVTGAETWAWAPNPRLRAVQVRGLSAIDPQRTTLPQPWRKGTAYAAPAGAKMRLRVDRRGQPEPPPNRISLRRKLWLDMDGGHYTARDHVTGVMHRDWRLDFDAEGALGRVARQGRDRLITTHPQTGKPGVELRAGKLDVTADLRLKVDADLPAVGWDFDARSLHTTLHLPPGWRLLGADGVDRAPGTWLGSWTLFDFFLVLMVALGAGRLLGWPWAAVALLAMVACHGEHDAPRWVWLHIFTAMALLRVVPAGIARKLTWVYRGGAVLWLLLLLVPFSISQVRGGVYPQVRHGSGFESGLVMADAAPVEEEQRITEQSDEKKRVILPMRRRAKVPATLNAKYSKGWKSRLPDVDPNAVVQTGPGLPDWRWSTWELTWSGPVQRSQRVRLLLLSPTHNLLLSLLRVLLLVVLAMASLELSRWRALARRLGGGAAASSAAALLLGGVSAAVSLYPSVALASSPRASAPGAVQVAQVAQVAQAGATPPQLQQQQQVVASDSLLAGNRSVSQQPVSAAAVEPPALLEQLQQRLVAAAQCQGPCTVTPKMALTLRGDRLEVRAEVHAQRLAAWTVPGPLSAIAVREVRVDGKPSVDLRRADAGMLLLRLSAGRHLVTVVADLPPRNVVALQFGKRSRPRLLTVDAQGWHVDGVGQTGVADSTLQLSRKRVASAPAGATVTDAESDLPPWYAVQRSLLLGMPWTVETTTRRQHAQGPALLKLPLLPGETVLSGHVRVERGVAGNVALVQFPRGTSEVRFESELPVQPSIALLASPDGAWTERWTVRCSPIFRCRSEGIAPISTIDEAGQHAFDWAPWPGEKVKLLVKRPAGAPGQAVTVDRVDYNVRPGNRLLEATLQLSVRASRGGFRVITLPEGAALQRVSVDGKERSLRAVERKVRLPLRPGKQRFELRWQQAWARSFNERVPAVDLGGKAVNVRISITRGEDRWLLWAKGPPWGPAVLFWSHALVLLLLAFGLGSVPGSPLRRWQWLLLSIGFAQVPLPVLLVVVGWFGALTWRRSFWRDREELDQAAWFNLTQIALVALTIASLAAIYGAIHSNLLLDVDMQVSGAGSVNQRLRWYLDRVDHALPQPAMLSLPLVAWRLAMLGWSLWLVWSLLRWLPWAWSCFSDGSLWRKTRRVIPEPPGEVAPLPASASPSRPAATGLAGGQPAGRSEPTAEEDEA